MGNVSTDAKYVVVGFLWFCFCHKKIETQEEITLRPLD